MKNYRAVIPRERNPDDAPITLIGSYMPFAGVRYYKMLTDVDIALGGGRIESVGWRAERQTSEPQTASPPAASIAPMSSEPVVV